MKIPHDAHTFLTPANRTPAEPNWIVAAAENRLAGIVFTCPRKYFIEKWYLGYHANAVRAVAEVYCPDFPRWATHPPPAWASQDFWDYRHTYTSGFPDDYDTLIHRVGDLTPVPGKKYPRDSLELPTYARVITHWYDVPHGLKCGGVPEGEVRGVTWLVPGDRWFTRADANRARTGGPVQGKYFYTGSREDARFAVHARAWCRDVRGPGKVFEGCPDNEDATKLLDYLPFEQADALMEHGVCAEMPNVVEWLETLHALSLPAYTHAAVEAALEAIVTRQARTLARRI